MADAGFSSDNKLIRNMIRENKLLNINSDDVGFIVDIKQRMNNLILEDTIKNSSFCGRKTEYHTAWGKSYRLLIKINQIRQKNWYFNPIL